MSAEILAQAFADARRVLAEVRPEQLDLPTPCASWDVRALVNHLVAGSYFVGMTVEAGKETRPPAEDFAAGNFVERYDEGSKRAVEAFSAPGALERTIRLPFGEFPGAIFMRIAATDHLVHSWDLARATSQPTDLDPKLATELLENAKMSLPEEFRGPDGKAPFGPRQEAPENATAADRLAAFLGRSV